MTERIESVRSGGNTRPLLALLAVLGLMSAGAARARAFTAEERRFLAGHHALLEASSDPCRLASRLEAQYKRLLRGARPAQDVADILATAEGKPGVPLILGDGVRLANAFALYDDQTRTVYLSSAALTPRVIRTAGVCPSDESLAALARETAGVYVHEMAHSLTRKALGAGSVATSEDEILAYAREARFLAGLKGWPSKAVAGELGRRRELDELVRKNQKIIGLVKGLQGQDPGGDGFKKFPGYVEQLEKIRRRMELLQAREGDVDPFQVSLAAMVDAWKDGWPAFLRMMIRQTAPMPSLGRRAENLNKSRSFLEASRAQLTEEAPGTLAHEVAERSVRLGEQDVLFWGDQKRVEEALAYYQRRFKTVRPPPGRR